MGATRIPGLEKATEKVYKKENEANLSLILGTRDERKAQALWGWKPPSIRKRRQWGSRQAAGSA